MQQTDKLLGTLKKGAIEKSEVILDIGDLKSLVNLQESIVSNDLFFVTQSRQYTKISLFVLPFFSSLGYLPLTSNEWSPP